MLGSGRFVSGFLFWVWMKSGNLTGSLMKKTGVLFPTKSQFPSSVQNLIAKPLGSLWVSADPFSPPTVENLAKMGVFSLTFQKTLALVYLVRSLVTTKYPWAPDPLAWTTRSGILSRSKWASLSMRWKSEITRGPYSPAVTEFWLSSTGCPLDVVKIFFSI